jgi:peroxiredoxin
VGTDSLAEVLEQAFLACRSLDAPLATRLERFAGEVRRINPQFAAAVDRLVARLNAGEAGNTAPKPGEPMPPFVLPDDNSELVSLDQFLEKGPVAISFHRGYWCPYCRINANALEDAQKKVAEHGGQIVAVTPDTQKYASGLKAEAGATFPILTDIDNGYAMSLDLAIWVGEEMRKLMVESGFDPGISQGSENWMLPIPATFVVGTDGIVKARFVDPDYRKRMEIDELVAALKDAGAGG